MRRSAWLVGLVGFGVAAIAGGCAGSEFLGSTGASSAATTGGATTGHGGASTGSGGASTGSGGASTGSGGASTGSGGASTGGGGASTGSGGASTGGGGASTGGGGGPADAGGVDAATDAGGGVDAAADAGADCDPTEQASAVDGVFVSSGSGSDLTGTGTKVAPLASIGAGLAAAVATGRKVLYLDQGTYAEKVVLGAAHGGIEVRGGWKALGAAWSRACGAVGATLIKSPEAVAVDVAGTLPAAGLREVTITTRPKGVAQPDTPGESVFAVRVQGAGTYLTLASVEVIAGAGGDGGAASAGVTPPAAAGTCEGACSDGHAGTSGAAVKPAGPGQFAGAGYVPGDGHPGQGGTDGAHGVAGKPGDDTCTTCAGCGALHCLCACCQSGCGNWCEAGTQGSETVQTKPGPCGCGGKGASGGQPGRGGGASVALLVVGGAAVVASSSSFAAGSGGAGSPGGHGAQGGTPSDGKQSTAACAKGSCQCDFVGCGAQCSTSGGTLTVKSQPGLGGGSGGASSDGGGGAGGPSYAVVVGQGSSVAAPDSQLVPGAAGPGATGAPAGEVGATLQL